MTRSHVRSIVLLCLLPLDVALAQKPADPPVSPFLGGTCPPFASSLCIPLDASFQVVVMNGPGGSGAASPSDPCQRNDDDTTLAIPLQFSFDFYGSIFNQVFINNNGNVSFGQAFSTFTPEGFPIADFPMIAPFWGDVDTGNAANSQGGVVWVKSEPHRFTVIWDHVGYFDENFDKVNTFELILTDGTDPLVGIGQNVCFCYADMQWTTGDASDGIGGFGGTPATVGANRGNGVDFFQVGRFGNPGAAYDGPGGAVDGIDYLDGRTICFNTSILAPNVAPIALGLPPANTYGGIGVNAEFSFDVQFIGPEVPQTVGVTVADGGLDNFRANVTPGNPATVHCTFTPNESQVGTHVVQFTATDNGVPPQSTIVSITLQVSQCFILVGLAPANMPVANTNDVLLVSPLTCVAKSVPAPVSIPIPANPGLLGLHVFTQAALYDASAISDKIKLSAGLDIAIGGAATPYGVGSGLTQTLLGPATVGGAIDLQVGIE